jgi:hypothetical protein
MWTIIIFIAVHKLVLQNDMHKGEAQSGENMEKKLSLKEEQQERRISSEEEEEEEEEEEIPRSQLRERWRGTYRLH